METPQQSRWLTDEEMETWHALAGVMVRLPSALDAELQRDAGVSHVEYVVMAMLSQTEGRTLRMSDLAGYVGSSLSRLSHLVKRLEKSDWVRREPDPSDGRYTLAVLTDAGHAKLVASAPGHAAAVRRYVFDALTRAQQRQLRDIGRRIWRTVAPDDHCLPPPS
ncbi:MarR family transcriptional regulator [Streptomyces sp. MNU76]|uniref:MarR family winged helix-turn-helix transcriptional regulator n=1 Tax=Streptomyces sp. MNU76 TaxID=2560026 RepID=UPI001E60E970|nr:MarR family transcriptional regulator [Streptomyces sp. MNU76]MCC9705322.1 MarR family transcriptional regulator [Streptomyces sp. MNU76]